MPSSTNAISVSPAPPRTHPHLGDSPVQAPGSGGATPHVLGRSPRHSQVGRAVCRPLREGTATPRRLLPRSLLFIQPVAPGNLTRAGPCVQGRPGPDLGQSSRPAPASQGLWEEDGPWGAVGERPPPTSGAQRPTLRTPRSLQPSGPDCIQGAQPTPPSLSTLLVQLRTRRGQGWPGKKDGALGGPGGASPSPLSCRPPTAYNGHQSPDQGDGRRARLSARPFPALVFLTTG